VVYLVFGVLVCGVLCVVCVVCCVCVFSVWCVGAGVLVCGVLVLVCWCVVCWCVCVWCVVCVWSLSYYTVLILHILRHRCSFSIK
jgi:hypothetical protein